MGKNLSKEEMARVGVSQDEIHQNNAKQQRAFTSVDSTCSFILWISNLEFQWCFWRLIQNEGKQDNLLNQKAQKNWVVEKQHDGVKIMWTLISRRVVLFYQEILFSLVPSRHHICSDCVPLFLLVLTPTILCANLQCAKCFT